MTTEERHFRNINNRLREVLPNNVNYCLQMSVDIIRRNNKERESYHYNLQISQLNIIEYFKSRKALVAYLDKNVEGFYSQPRRYQ